MTRDTRTAYRARTAATERSIDEAKAELEAARDAEYRAVKAEAREREASRVRFTRDELVGAVAVRDRLGWHRVVRVNQKTVTIKTGYSWTDLLPIDRVLEVRR